MINSLNSLAVRVLYNASQGQVGALPAPELVGQSSWARGPVGQSVRSQLRIWWDRARGPVGPWARAGIQYLVSSIQYLVSGIQYLVSRVWYLVSNIWYLVSSIQYPVSSIQYLVSSIEYRVSSIQYLVSLSHFHRPLFFKQSKAVQGPFATVSF